MNINKGIGRLIDPFVLATSYQLRVTRSFAHIQGIEHGFNGFARIGGGVVLCWAGVSWAGGLVVWGGNILSSPEIMDNILWFSTTPLHIMPSLKLVLFFIMHYRPRRAFYS